MTTDETKKIVKALQSIADTLKRIEKKINAENIDLILGQRLTTHDTSEAKSSQTNKQSI